MEFRKFDKSFGDAFTFCFIHQVTNAFILMLLISLNCDFLSKLIILLSIKVKVALFSYLKRGSNYGPFYYFCARQLLFIFELVLELLLELALLLF